ncbi:TOBE domain-containing protein, partial [Methanocalculus sp.]|uniref:TOBE domain-containing protein n=1 Tax=Methanocalculus sp. TaxID=2004547 RepID=UPI002620E328
GTPREIFSAPHDRYVARFVGIENIIEGTITGKDGGLATIEADGTLLYAISPLTESTHVHLFLRPEDIALSCTGEHATSVRNILPGKVVEIIPMGPLNRLILDCGIQLIAVITWKATEELGISVGSEICASFKASAVHVVKR